MLSIGAASPAAAHDFWIEPSSFHVALDVPVLLRLRVGQNLEGEPVPRDESAIDRFVTVGPTGETPVIGRDGTDPAGIIAPSATGSYVVGYQSRPAPIELEAGKFEAYLLSEGLERVSSLRAARGQSSEPARELFTRCAKSLLAAGTGPSGDAWSTSLGLTLEIVPERDPRRLSVGDEVSFAVLYDGNPLAHALLIGLNRDAHAHVQLRTDQHGRATLRLGAPGLWLVKAVHMLPLGPGMGGDWESYWASLTFEIGSTPP
jgi:uncharacterized GH25 family protein